jgi:hypothetical protein
MLSWDKTKQKGLYMSESDWLACKNPGKMLLLSIRKTTDRKMRLFAATCCRLLWHMFRDDRSRKVIEVAERFADGVATREELDMATAYGMEVANAAASGGPGVPDLLPYYVAVATTRCDERQFIRAARRTAAWVGLGHGRGKEMCDMLRCIFGNPVRPLRPLDAALLTWQNGVVTELAQAAYDERVMPKGTLDPACLAVLCDALEEADAGSQLISHLRSPGPHVRGCFALDAILGKNEQEV